MVRLIVNDGMTDSAPVQVRVSFANVKPVADAGHGQSVTVGDTVTLKGTKSSDANRDPLTYQWSLAAVPPESSLGNYSSTGDIATFNPDAVGDYVVQLVVNDGFVNSDPATVQIHVAASRAALVIRLQDLVALISGLDAQVFKSGKMRDTLINKLNATITKVEAGHYTGAINTLDDVLVRTDGCATSGAPDINDWIIDSTAQGQVYPEVLATINLMQ